MKSSEPVMAAPASILDSSSHTAARHLHISADICPLCEQPIPHDRFDEIKERIDEREKAASAAIAERLREEHIRETAEAVEAARREASAEIAHERQQSAARVESARVEGQQAAEAAAAPRLLEAQHEMEVLRETLTAKLSDAEGERQKAESANLRIHEQLEDERSAGKATLEKALSEAAAKEIAIREQASRDAAALVRERVASLEAARKESEEALLRRASDAESAAASVREQNALLLATLETANQEAAATLERADADAIIREAAAREDAGRLAEAAFQARIEDAEHAKKAAEAKAAEAEEATRLLKEEHESQIEARVSEVRSAMEAAQEQAVNAVKAGSYEEKLKLSERVGELQRALDRKTAEEQGEGAEVNLCEALKGSFEGDRIERVGRGNPGADIIHIVMHNGMECGKIIYDSKDHNQWRYDFVTKLASDKIAAKADHAVLAVRKFPQGMRQIDVIDGVILANPARVVALVQVIREHIVKSHALRMSNEAKAQKSAELYAFITSAQCSDLLNRIDLQAQELLDMQVSEKRAHDNLWKRQAILVRSIQKTGADLSNRIDIILGTARSAEKAVNDE